MMRRIARLLLPTLCLLTALPPLPVLAQPANPSTDSSSLRLHLPSEIYAVVGTEFRIDFDNIVLTETPELFQFTFDCKLGQVKPKSWSLTPQPSDVGTYQLNVTVRDSKGKLLEQARTQLQVVPRDSGTGKTVKLLIVGDSLTHATQYPNEIARLLSRPENPQWQMLGTHRPSSAAEGVRHEGYGGWTWQRFVSQYEPNPDGTHRKRSSPFVYLGADGKPSLDLDRYFAESADGGRPDVVFFLLGINDCFSADPEDPAAIDARIDSMLEQADILLAAFRKSAPYADLAIGITTPPNARESGFEANYKGRYHRWGWKRIQHRLVERLHQHYASQASTDRGKSKAGRLFLVPTHLNLDPVAGYPDNNGVHPNATGYQQIGRTVYAWLKWRLAE